MVPDVPSDLFVMFSTAPGDKAEDAAGKRNSPFAEAFLKYMKASEPVTMMVADVANETMSLTGGRQRPYITGSIISEKYYSLNQAAASVGSITVSSEIAGVIMIDGRSTGTSVKAGGTVTVTNVTTGATELA